MTVFAPRRLTTTDSRLTRQPLTPLADMALQPSIEHAVDAVLEFLGTDIACATEILGGEHHVRVLRGDGASFQIHEGLARSADDTLAARMLTGRLPNIIADVSREPRAANLPAAAAMRLGAFASVPLTFSDGRAYGTLWTASHTPQPGLGYRELQFLRVLARMIVDLIEREQTQETIRTLEIQAAVTGTLVASLEARDAYTGEHSKAVVGHAGAIARSLGLSAEQTLDVEHVALLHDIGKIAIPDAILQKRGPLTDGEWTVMRTHPVISERLVRDVTGLAHLAPAIRAEHEQWDGGGYPDGLSGESIPVASRITFVCDAYHAMTTTRPYRRALPAHEARSRIRAGIATQFCPTSADALLQLLASSP